MAVERIAQAAQDKLDKGGRFRIVLAGGETPLPIYASLAEIDTDWLRWDFFFSDERCVPKDDPARNDRLADEVWLRHVGISPSQIFGLPGELGVRAGARQAEAVIADVPPFDLVLLGLGEDGHTASLFPGRKLGDRPGAPAVIGVSNAPKPPSQRLTLSARRLSNAHRALFLVNGLGKREALASWRAGARIPAARIAPIRSVEILYFVPGYPEGLD